MLAAAGPWQKTHGLDPNGTYQGNLSGVLRRLRRQERQKQGNKSSSPSFTGTNARDTATSSESAPDATRSRSRSTRQSLRCSAIDRYRCLAEARTSLPDSRVVKPPNFSFKSNKRTAGLKTQEIVKGWINPINSYDNFERRLTSKIHEVEVEVSSNQERSPIRAKRKLTGWKYQPQALTTRRLKHEMAPFGVDRQELVRPP